MAGHHDDKTNTGNKKVIVIIRRLCRYFYMSSAKGVSQFIYFKKSKRAGITTSSLYLLTH